MYIDPGAGSIILQVVGATVIGFLATVSTARQFLRNAARKAGRWFHRE